MIGTGLTMDSTTPVGGASTAVKKPTALEVLASHMAAKILKTVKNQDWSTNKEFRAWVYPSNCQDGYSSKIYKKAISKLKDDERCTAKQVETLLKDFLGQGFQLENNMTSLANLVAEDIRKQDPTLKVATKYNLEKISTRSFSQYVTIDVSK